MTMTAAASPAPLSAPAAAATLARFGPSAGAMQVLMLNGDRLFVRPVPGGALTALSPAPFGQAVVTLHISGATYQIPLDALPYLGHGLDPSLFNLALLERAESAGRLPVRLTFSGSERALPGIKVASRTGRTMIGYLTAASAKVFGAALFRQFSADHLRADHLSADHLSADHLRADHAAAGYASSPLFDGVRIALAGTPAAAPIPVRPQFPMRTLTVTATNEFKNPDSGDIVLVINADNPGLFGDPIETANIFYHGVAKYSLPAGHYWAITDFVTLLKNSLSQRVVVMPQFTVKSSGKNDSKINLSAKDATSLISVRTPRASTGLSDTWSVVRTSPHGITATVATSSVGAVYISPTTAKPSVGTIQSYTSAQLVSPTSASPPYAYNLDFAGPVGRIPAQRFVVTPGSLATVHERYYNGSPTFGAWVTAGGFLPQLGSLGIGGFTAEIKMPGLQTQYMSGGNSIVWQSLFFADNGASQQDSIRTLLPGQQLTENWNQYPLHPQPFAQLLTGHLATIFSQVPSAYRIGDNLFLSPAPVSDNQVGHIGAAGFDGGFTVRQNGRQIAGGGFGGTVQVKVSAQPSVIRFALHVQQINPLSVLSPASNTVWTTPTSQQPHAVVPSSWVCITAGGDVTKHCAAQPMLTLNYQVGNLGLDGVVPAGPEHIDVSVGHFEPAASSAIAHASGQVSYDGGQFWHAVTLSQLGPGQYRMSFSPPAGVDVTLMFTASDAAANSISETITNAYSVGP
jgi:hypothetical protein